MNLLFKYAPYSQVSYVPDSCHANLQSQIIEALGFHTLLSNQVGHPNISLILMLCNELEFQIDFDVVSKVFIDPILDACFESFCGSH